MLYGVDEWQVSDEEMEAYEAEQRENEALTGSNYILDTPIHDSGSKIYAVLGFLLPLLALLACIVLKKVNYLRTYKMLKKGAIAGLIVIGVLILILAILLVIAAI